MNFVEEFKKGQAGLNKGLPMGEGLETISKAILSKSQRDKNKLKFMYLKAYGLCSS